MGQHHKGLMAYHAGEAAECLVERHYRRKGLKPECRRWRGTGGEIDLIVRDSDGLIFVEVKKSRDFARAAQRISARQMHRIMASASEFLAQEPNGMLTNARFDVALVDGQGRLEILENAFFAE